MSDDGLLVKFIGIYLQYATFLVAVFLNKKYKNYAFYKFFVGYLFTILFFDILARYKFKLENHDLFNIYTFFEFNSFAFIYYHLITETKRLQLVKMVILTFNAIYLLSFFVAFLEMTTIPLEGVANSILIILYFSELLNSDKILNYKKLFPFWMSVGFLLFYLTSIPFFTLLSLNMFDNRLMFPIIYYLTIVFHLVLNYGLITCNKINK